MTGAQLHQAQADLFRALAHPMRIRILELLSEGEQPVAQLVHLLGVEHSYLSQQLAVLRRIGLVSTRRTGPAAHCSLTDPQLADLLAVARAILGGLLSEKAALLAELQAPPPPRSPG